MPNWVINKVRAVNKNDTEKLIKILLRKDGNGILRTNFNGILPMPKELANTEYNSTEDSQRIRAENKSKYGYESWYDFGVDVWGTKWDNNCAEIDDDLISFSTAWSMPLGVYRKISKTIPIIVAYADEDIGENMGIFMFDKHGMSRVSVSAAGTPIQIANAIWGHEYSGDEDDREGDYSESVSKEIETILTK